MFVLRALKRIAARYDAMLMKYPMITKAVTSCTVVGTGDVIAQKLTTDDFSHARLSNGLFFVFWISVPLSHVHLNFLHWLVTKKLAIHGKNLMPLTKMVIEQFGYWTPSFLVMYHSFLGYSDGLTSTEIIERVKLLFWPSLKANWALWPLAQIINFKFIPIRHQINFGMTISLGWSAYLSFLANPPKSDSKKNNKQETALEHSPFALPDEVLKHTSTSVSA